MADAVQQVPHGIVVLWQASLPGSQDERPRPPWDVQGFEEKPAQHKHGEFESRGLRADLGTQGLEARECFIYVLDLPAAEAEQVDDAPRTGLDGELAESPFESLDQHGQARRHGAGDRVHASIPKLCCGHAAG